MKREDLYANICRYLFLAGGVLGSLACLSVHQYPLFMLLALLFSANSQVRLMLKNPWLTAFSLLLDGCLILALSLLFKCFVGLLALVSLTDILLNLEAPISRRVPLIPVTALLYGMAFHWIDSYLLALPILMIYVASLLLLLGLFRERRNKNEAEARVEELKRITRELEAARASLLDYSRQVERITKLEERNRISRDLHDTIGHSLTGILLQVDAAIQILEIDREKGMGILRSAYSNINNSIETVRKTVRRLKPAKGSEASLEALAEKFMEDTGIKVKLRSSGEVHEMLPSVKTVLYRNMKEALTNSARHGEATEILIEMIYSPEGLEAVITDNGKGCGAVRKGLGLSGMEERLHMIGGSMACQSDGGFTLHMTLPGGLSEYENESADRGR